MKKTTIIRIAIFVCFLGVFFSCKEEVFPKPKAMLRLSYPTPKYQKVDIPCQYSFEMNTFSKLRKPKRDKKCWYNLDYDEMKATVYISYFTVSNNLDSLLRDAQNLTQEHYIKADGIKPEEYTNVENKVYGMFYEVTGNAASPTQFYATDSTRHFLVGSIYFNTKPNYDSILPAANYLRNDIRHMLETLSWKE